MEKLYGLIHKGTAFELQKFVEVVAVAEDNAKKDTSIRPSSIACPFHARGG